MASDSGKGSTFTVWLPAAVAPPPSPSLVDFTLPAVAGPADGLAVLVIDDDVAVRDVLTRVLAQEGYRVRTADGRTGLQMAAADRPDVFVLDIIMPRMDGWAVLSTLQADRQLDDIPVNLHTMVDEPNLGYALGAADYLTKPVDRDRLVAVLNKYRTRAAAGGVLVVEDDADTRQAVVRALANAGWPVAEAENGRVALDRLAAAKPAVVALDLMMPEMDGFEFLEVIRKTPAWTVATDTRSRLSSSLPLEMRLTSIRSSTSRTICPNCRSMRARACSFTSGRSDSLSTWRALRIGASGFRSSWASVARNSFW